MILDKNSKLQISGSFKRISLFLYAHTIITQLGRNLYNPNKEKEEN